MSLSSETNRVNATGNGNTSSYSYTFKIYEDADLLVTVRNTSGVETTLALTTDYTVTGAGNDAGGSISLVNSGQAWLTAGGKLISGYIIAIRRVLDLVQETDIRNQGDFFPEVHEDQFDRLVMQDQQQQDAIDRSLKMPETLDPADFDATIPATIVGQGNRVIGTNEDGDGIEVGPTYDEISGAQASATAAATSATASATSATASATSATAAAASATAAATSATNAATSATGAATSATASATSATASAGSAAAAAASETQCGNFAVITGTDALSTTASAAAAATSATNAATSATTATTQAGIATTQASNAATSATNAANSASAAATSATAAAASAAASTGLANYANDAAFVSANGAAQTGDAYFNTTLGKVRVYSGTAWVEVGSGAGGATNFITNHNAETDTSGFATYNDGAAAIVDGTGGTASGITFTRSTSSPLIGTASFLLSRTAAALGQGVSYDFTIDSAYQAKVLQIGFEYRAISGTLAAGSTSSDGDVVVYLIDRTNGTVIQPSTYKLFASSSTIATTFVSNFQTASNSTAYRLCFHIPNSTATAFGLQLDDIRVSPSQYVYGTTITDFANYTPTFAGFGTVTSPSMWWRRVGDSVEIYGKFTSGTVSAVTASFTTPNSVVIDSTKVPAIRASGYFTTNNAARTTHGGAVTITGGNSTVNFGELATYGGSSVTNNVVASTGTAVAVSGDVIYVDGITAPIAGWSSSVQTSDQGDSRVTAARYQLSAAQSIPQATLTTVVWNSRTFDTHAMMNTSTGLVTIPTSGYYEWKMGQRFAANATGIRYVATIVNGVASANAYNVFNTNTDQVTSTASDIRYFSAGDTFGVQVWQNSGAALNLNGSGADSAYFTIHRLSQASLMSATETVAMRYVNTAGTSIANATGPIVPFATKDYDTHSAYNTSTGVFTCPVAGKFRVTAKLAFASASFPAGTLINIGLNKNGGDTSAIGTVNINATVTTQMHVFGSDTLNCNANDTLSVYLYQDTGGARSLSTDNRYNHIIIERIGM